MIRDSIKEVKGVFVMWNNKVGLKWQSLLCPHSFDHLGPMQWNNQEVHFCLVCVIYLELRHSGNFMSTADAAAATTPLVTHDTLPPSPFLPGVQLNNTLRFLSVSKLRELSHAPLSRRVLAASGWKKKNYNNFRNPQVGPVKNADISILDRQVPHHFWEMCNRDERRK